MNNTKNKNINYTIKDLKEAIYNKNFTLTKKIIEKNPELINGKNSFDENPLAIAISEKDNKIVELLLDNNADVNLSSPLYTAAFIGNTEAIQLLVARGAKVDKISGAGYSPLMIAAQQNNIEVLNLLITLGANVDFPNNNGETALFYAARWGNNDIRNALINESAQVNNSDNNGRTPLFAAVRANNFEAIEFLINNNADINHCDKDNRTLLFSAAETGNTKIVDLLISKNANINHRDKDGITPLLVAAKINRDIKFINYLIDKGAKADCIDNRNQDISNYLFMPNPNALALSDKDIKSLFEKDGFNTNIKSKIFSNVIFDLAYKNNSAQDIIDMLSSSQHPFPINSLDREGHNLLYYYNNTPKMQKFLFEQGAIPQKEQEQGLSMGQLVNDDQGVHAKEVNELNHYVVSELVKSYGENKENNKGMLLHTAMLYKDYSLNDLNNLTPLEIKLFGLSDSRKRNTLDKVITEDQQLPNDNQFINMVTNKVNKVLNDKYLNEDSGYYSHENAYNTQGDKITIPETIGLVKQLINNREPSTEEKKELLASLIEQNPGLVKTNLSKIKEKLAKEVTLDKLSNKADCHILLKDIDDKTMEELFKNISGLDLNATLRKQQDFQLAESLYWAATAYGDNNSSCVGGTWTQIVNAADAINPAYRHEFAKLNDKEGEEERKKSGITLKSAENLTQKISENLIKKSQEDQNLKKFILDFMELKEEVNLDKPEKITFEQQKILSEINKIFKLEINSCSPNYNRAIPTSSEYKMIIEKLKANTKLYEFVGIHESSVDEKILDENIKKSINGQNAEYRTRGVNEDIIKNNLYDLSNNLGQKIGNFFGDMFKKYKDKLSNNDLNNLKDLTKEKLATTFTELLLCKDIKCAEDLGVSQPEIYTLLGNKIPIEQEIASIIFNIAITKHQLSEQNNEVNVMGESENLNIGDNV